MGIELNTFKSVRRLRPAELVYSRGSLTVELTGLRSNPSLRRIPFSQIAINLQGEDFLVSQADLVLDGEVVEPQPGDRIAELVNGTELIYEVIRLDDNICWRWTGSEHEVIRIHCKLVQ